MLLLQSCVSVISANLHVMPQGAPYQTLSVPAASWQGVGLTDMALPAKGSYNAIATAQNGHVSGEALQLVLWFRVDPQCLFRMSIQHTKACTIIEKAVIPSLCFCFALCCSPSAGRTAGSAVVPLGGSSVRVGIKAVVLAGISVGPTRGFSA